MPRSSDLNTSVELEPLGVFSSAPSVGDFIRTYIWLILACTSVSVLASFIYLKYQKPVYEAAAVIRIDPERAGSLGLGDLFSGQLGDQSDAMRTEMAIIKSDAVAVETLNVLSNEEFLEFAHVSKDGSLIPENTPALPAFDEALISKVQSNTTVRQEKGTQLIDVRFRDGDPRVAAMMANKVVAAYSLQTFKSRGKSVDQLRSYLLERMNVLRDNLAASQAKLAAFQQENQILGPSDEKNTITDRLTSLNTKLTDAQATRIAAEAQLKAANSGDPTALATLFPNPGLTRLQNDEASAEAEASQMSTKFGANYPPLAQKRKQIDMLKGQISSSVESVKAQLKQSYEAAHNYELMLQQQYNEQMQLAYGLNRSQAEYATLQSEVSSTRELYDMLQRKLQQAEVDTQVGSISTVPVDDARAPMTPVEPKRSIILSTSLLIGLFAGVIAAIVFEISLDRVRSPESIQRPVGFPALGSIPASTRADRGSLTTLEDPSSPASEAYRGLRYQLMSRAVPGSTILFASAGSGEGADYAVANVAVSLAQTKARVLLIDADLRQPSLHTLFDVPNALGLGEFLSCSPLHPSEPLKSLPSLSLVTAGKRLTMPADALTSAKLATSVEEWKSAYDFILFLVPPLLEVSDGMPLTRLLDMTVLVTKYRVSQVRAVGSLLKLLSQSDAKLAGFILLDVPKSIGTFSGQRVIGETDHA